MHEHSILFELVNRCLTGTFGRPPVEWLSQQVSPGFAHFVFPDPHYWLPDHVIVAAFLVLLLAVVLIPASRRYRRETPGGLQNVLEMVVGGLRGLLTDVIGRHAAHEYLPIIGAFAVFIALCNLTGLFFFLTPPTSNMNTNLALAICSFVFYNARGFLHAGPKYVLHFAGPKLGFGLFAAVLFGIFFFVIEIISHFARIVSLTLRLTGNISGEHLASGIFAGFLPVFANWPMMALGIIGALMQTFIFIMLSMVYIAGATAEEHGSTGASA